jgi:hypothetical protein
VGEKPVKSADVHESKVQPEHVPQDVMVPSEHLHVPPTPLQCESLEQAEHWLPQLLSLPMHWQVPPEQVWVLLQVSQLLPQVPLAQTHWSVVVSQTLLPPHCAEDVHCTHVPLPEQYGVAPLQHWPLHPVAPLPQL